MQSEVENIFLVKPPSLRRKEMLDCLNQVKGFELSVNVMFRCVFLYIYGWKQIK